MSRLPLVLGLFLALTVSASTQVNVPQNASDATFGPLQGGVTYVLPDGLNLTDTLTIEPGAILKVASNKSITVNATLNAVGTAADPIVITSTRDDSVGVVVDPGPAAPGDWRTLQFNTAGSGSSLRFVEVRFGGIFGNPEVFVSNGATPTLESCLISRSGGAGLDLGANSIAGFGGAPTVTSCRFEDNVGGGVVNVPLTTVPNFSGNTATGNLGGPAFAIRNGATLGDVAITRENLVDGTAVVTDTLLVQGGDTATIAEGVTLKFDRNPVFNTVGGVRAIGTLLCDGTPGDPILLTSVQDDATGGDAGADGPTVGVPGDWAGIELTSTSDASVLTSVSVRFGGAFQTGGVELNGADATLFDVAVESSSSDGLAISQNATPSVRECRFDDNLGRAMGTVNWRTLDGFLDNTAQGNALGDVTRVAGGVALAGFTRVDRWNTLNETGVIVAERQTRVQAGTVLTFGGGVILKFEVPSDSGFVSESGSLIFDGRGYAKVVLTSIHDDEFGGDTNGNGVATVGQPGDWRNVTYTNSSLGAQFNHAYLRFGGGSSAAAVLLDSDQVSMDHVRVDQSVSDGFNITDFGGGLRNLVAFVNQGDGVVLGPGNFGLIHATVAANIGRGIVAEDGNTGGIKSSISWFNGINAGDNMVGFGDGLSDPPRVFTSNGSPQHEGFQGNILVDPLFNDPDNGDLTLSLFSPCISGGGPGNAFTFEDHEGNSRTLDHNLQGFAISDMGAYEYHVYETVISGAARLGKSFTLTIQGNPVQGNPPATAYYFVGPPFPGTGLLFAGYGNLLIDGVFIVALPSSIPVGGTLPEDPALIGVVLGIQSLVIPLGNPGVGNWTNPFIETISE